jgi:hypothetical protein
MLRHKGVGDGPAQTFEPSPAFASKNCTELSYRISLPADKFSVDKFSEAIGSASVTEGWNSALLVSSNPQINDYHIHVYWEADDNDPSKTKLQVDYHAWPPEKDESEKHHVSADDFFDWASEYIGGETVQAHIHGEFEFPVEHWESRLLLLPTKVPFDNRTAVIDGFSVSLPTVPQGVNQTWVTWDKKKLKLQMYADRLLHLKKFTPHDDIDALSVVAKKLIGEKNL